MQSEGVRGEEVRGAGCGVRGEEVRGAGCGIAIIVNWFRFPNPQLQVKSHSLRINQSPVAI